MLLVDCFCITCCLKLNDIQLIIRTAAYLHNSKAKTKDCFAYMRLIDYQTVVKKILYVRSSFEMNRMEFRSMSLAELHDCDTGTSQISVFQPFSCK